ncbi:MAG: ATP-binding protein [Dokdonella sp.]|jgi:two-component system, sensor histidine kinase RpfC|uniref:ATP-binding protein n=1 Tax=Dokdonella sp. TaxID=2291710 RepID=UPI001B4513FE|nr:ATP-binding protein [Dokdonella sp.]MCC6440147.1 response regulator [Rhodanobacteraceae bacterium]MBK8122318.1 response regulator [Dokdonella sp.]MBP6325856.1 response regulator [Dokdonella sp.]MBP6328216.1 response regulator [Dokdonella sp.]HNV07581.1 ATP-binding protein [Dokdonella sp.]
MITDIVEGIADKSESALRHILKAQATLRILVAVPVIIVETILYLGSPASVAARLVVLSILYCVYILALRVLVHFPQIVSSRALLVATAVLDPLALTAWLVVTGEYGGLIVGFYLFTILGFGFRTGRPLMYLCQLTAVAGFLLVCLGVPYWQEHLTTFLALLIPLLVVPMYAGMLIKSLRESRELAERESKAKSELLAKVSHELRTPLAGIISATELMAGEATQEVVRRRADTILSLSGKLLREINDLLDEAKLDAGATRLELAPVDIKAQVDLVHAALAEIAVKKGIDFQIRVDPAIVDRVQTDAHHLGRVLLNLSGNAVKFTDQGHVRLTVDLVRMEESRYVLRFGVSDTGIGIPDAFKDRMFQPFSQGQGTHQKYGGTGLGLVIARQIVELMGGVLRFESEIGRGSLFWFEVSMGRCLAIAGVDATDALHDGSISTPKRILVAEDNETNLILLRELLEIDGHVVTTCSSGTEALEILAERDFDLILLDYNLGDMDGVRVLQTWHFGHARTTPALFLTADTTQQTAQRISECTNGSSVLYKPVTLLKLRKALSAIEACAPGVAEKAEISQEIMYSAARQAKPALTSVAVTALDAEIIAELKTVSHRAEFFPSLLREAEHDMVRCVQHILEALEKRQHGAVRDAAHALKGVSGSVGAVRVYALASSLMATPGDDLDRSAERWAADVSEALRITIAALRREIEAAGNAAESSSGSPSLHFR